MGLHAPSAEQAEHDTRQPRRVFLFSGHMIDAPDRHRARFPPEMEQAAGDAIAAQLDDLGMNERDLAICGGATALSHVNDAGFWMCSSFLEIDEKTTLKSWTVMETLIGLSGLACALVISFFA